MGVETEDIFMTELELSIARLAALGRSPYQIEETLGIPHYTIHQKYHAALMAGYEARARRCESKNENSSMTNQQKEKQNDN